jgi:hypothetical protein
MPRYSILIAAASDNFILASFEKLREMKGGGNSYYQLVGIERNLNASDANDTGLTFVGDLSATLLVRQDAARIRPIPR